MPSLSTVCSHTILALYLREVVPLSPDKPARQLWHYPISAPVMLLLRRLSRMHSRKEGDPQHDSLALLASHDYQVLDGDLPQSTSSDAPQRHPATEPLESSVFKSPLRVSLRHVTKRYAVSSKGGSSGTCRPAVDDVSADLLPGQVTVLLGHNGAHVACTMRESL